MRYEKTVICILASLLVLGLVFTAAHADTTKKIQKTLKANYAKIAEGFKHNNPEVWIGFLVPDFQLKLFNGTVQDRKWVEDYVRNNAKTFTILKLSMEVKELTVEGDEATAIVEQKSSRTFDEQGQPHELDVGALQREIWTKTRNGWKLRRVEEWKVLYLLKDGKPMT